MFSACTRRKSGQLAIAESSELAAYLIGALPAYFALLEAGVTLSAVDSMKRVILAVIEIV